MGIQLVIKNGDVAGAYKRYAIGVQIGMQMWKRNFKDAYVAINGKPILNGVPHFGGRVNVNNFPSAALIKLADYCGISDAGRAEISNVYNSNDCSTYINLVAKRIYTLDAMWLHFRDEIAPQVPLGSVLVYKQYHTIVQAKDLPPPPLPTPSIIKFSPSDSIYSDLLTSSTDTSVHTGLASDELNRTYGYIYKTSSFFENNAESIVLDISLLSAVDDLANTTYSYETTATISLGSVDLAYLSNRGIIESDIYAVHHLSDSDSSYFGLSGSARSTQFRTEYALNYAGTIWDYVNNWKQGTGGSFYNNSGVAIEGTYYYSDGAWSSLYINEAYWDALTPLAALVLVQQMANVGVEELGGGFWDTFVGSFLGMVIKAFTKFTDFIDALPIMSMTTHIIIYQLESIEFDQNIIDDFEKSVRMVRTAIVLYFISAGIGELGSAGGAAGGAAGSAGGVTVSAAMQQATYKLGEMAAWEVAVQFGAGAAASVLWGPDDYDMADPSTPEQTVQEENGKLSFEEGSDAPDGDYVDTAYWYMDNPLEVE